MSDNKGNYKVVLTDGTEIHMLNSPLTIEEWAKEVNDNDGDVFELWEDSNGWNYVINRNHIVYIKEID